MTNILGFMAREEHDIIRGRWISADEKLLPRDGEIWKFKLVNSGHSEFHYVKIVCVAYDEPFERVVVYTRCDENGIFISLRRGSGNEEKIIKQPFFLSDQNFLVSYEKFKEAKNY